MTSWRLVYQSVLRQTLIYSPAPETRVAFWLSKYDLESLIGAVRALRGNLEGGYGSSGQWLLTTIPILSYSQQAWACGIRYRDTEVSLPQDDFDALLKFVDKIVAEKKSVVAISNI